MNITLKHITGPQQSFGHMRDIQTADDYLKLQAEYMAAQRRGSPVFTAEPICAPMVAQLTAYVNESRLLVDCTCGNGVVVHAGWELALCFWCGSIYSGAQIRLPSIEDLIEIDEILGRRLPISRHFHPDHETLSDLRKGRA